MDNFRDSYFQVDWDLTTKRLKGTYWGKQYDTGRGFAVTVINGGQVVTPSNEVLRLKWEKPDNTTGYVNATIVNGKFIVENIDQMFTVHGSVRADFELSVGGEFVASITFYVNVEKAVAVDAIESSSDFTALQDALSNVDGTAGIDDSVVSGSKVWSSAKVQGEINNIMTLPNAVYVSFPPHIPPETPVENMLWFQIEVPEIPEIPIPVDDYFFRFDASKLDLEDGAKISLWEDSSSNAHHLIQETPSDQPTFLKEGLNGKPTVQFTNNFMDVSPFDFDRRNTFTTFIMLQVDDKSVSRSILMAGESGSATRTLGFRVSSSSDFVGCYINNLQKGYAKIQDNPTFLYSTVYDGSSNETFKDGVLESIPSYDQPITGSISSLRLGKALNNAEPYVGRVSEIVHFTRSLSEAERESVENYLIQKWGAI